MPETPTREVNVDLSPDDDATLDEIEQEVDDEPREVEAEVETPEIQKQAQNQAREYRNNAEGESEVEVLENALRAVGADIERMQQEMGQTSAEHTGTRDRIERLHETKERIARQPDAYPVLQTLAGGISLEVPPDKETVQTVDGEEIELACVDDRTYTRTDLLEEVDETVEALEEYVEQLEEQLGVAKLDHQKTQIAGKLLSQRYRTVVSEQRKAEQLADEMEW